MKQAEVEARRLAQKISEGARAAANAALAGETIANNDFSFLGSDDDWKRSLSLPRTRIINRLSTGKIATYGTMDGIVIAREHLQKLGVPSENISDPTKDYQEWLATKVRSVAGEARQLFGAEKVYMYLTESGASISQIETRAALTKGLLTGDNVLINNKKPQTPNSDAISVEEGKVWRSRMMIEADQYHLRRVYGDSVPLSYTTNTETRGIPSLTEAEAEARFMAQKHKPITPRTRKPNDVIVISGSSNEDNSAMRAQILEQLARFSQTPAAIKDTRFTTPLEFATNLPWTKIEENDLISGTNISRRNRQKLLPLINIVHAEKSYGDLSQATNVLTHAILNGTYEIIYAPTRSTLADNDYLSFQSMLRELVALYPDAARYVRVTDSLEKVVEYVDEIRKVHFPQTRKKNK